MNLSKIILDEIGLEGLDGISIDGLYTRLSVRLKLPLPLLDGFCKQVWNFIQKQNELEFYELPEPRPKIKLYDRLSTMDSDNGHPIEPIECPFTAYKYNPISKKNIRGSCEDYDTRTLIKTSIVTSLTLEEVNEKWGHKFIIVGSQRLRESTIIPNTIDILRQINIMQYCLLERIGRSRFTGESTHGKHSLLSLAKDPNVFHYHRKNLAKIRLIVRQPYAQKIGTQNITGSLVHLPRFYTEMKPKWILLTENVLQILKSKKNYIAEYDEIKNAFEFQLRDILKKLFKTIDFQRYVNTDLKIPYRELYPKAKKSEWKMKNKEEEKMIRVMQLIDPNVDINAIWQREEEPEDSEQGILDQSLNLVDVPLLKQAYEKIKESNENGISQSQLGKVLGQDKLSARAVCRNLKRLNEISTFIKDEGRQRVINYTLLKYKDKTSTQFKDVMNEINEVQEVTEQLIKNEIEENNVPELLNEDNNPPDDKTLLTNDIKNLNGIEDKNNSSSKNILNKENINAEIVVTNKLLFKGIKPPISMKQLMASNNGIASRKNVTIRMLKRANLILKTLKSHLVIDKMAKLLSLISTEEENNGFKDKICKKSLIRILNRLGTDNSLKFIYITLRYDNKINNLLYICHTSVNENHSMVKSYIEQAKLKFITSIKVSSMKQQTMERISLNKEKNLQNAKNNNSNLVTEDNNDNNANVSPTQKAMSLSICPKFIRMRVLHEFLFYLIYELPSDTKPISQEKTIEKLSAVEPNMDYKTMEKEIKETYTDAIDWKMFVPPLVQHSDWPNGWALMSDIITRLPLSIFTKLVNITTYVPQLEKYLEHPLRRHYLLNNLPTSLHETLLKSRKYIFSVDDVARRLCFIGLLQFGPQRMKEKDQVFIYLNRNASLLNTVSSEPSYYKIVDKVYSTIEYRFNSMDDVTRYWHDMWTISINTKLGKKSTVIGKEVVFETLHLKPDIIATLKPQTQDTVEANDKGKIPGDNLGAAGLDSAFFAHLKRNWNWNQFNKKEIAASEPIRRKKLNNIKAIKFNTLKERSCGVHLKIAGSQTTRKGTGKFHIVPLIKTQSNIRTQRKQIIIKKIKERQRREKKPFYDEIDKRALALMKKLRVEWTPVEDNMLLLCKVGFLYLCPSTKKQYLSFSTIRDILHWNCRSMNKTSKACQRRINYMMKNPTTNHNIRLCVEELKEHAEINKKFGINFTNELKEVYRNENEFMTALKVHYINLILIINKYFSTLTPSTFETVDITIPDNLDEFNNSFKQIDTGYHNEALKYYEPKSINDIYMFAITQLIHSSMCCGKDKTSWNIQLFDIYKNYPEKILSDAMKKIRIDQLIALNKTANKNTISSCKYMPLSSNPYHLSNVYSYQINTSLSYESIQEFFEKLKQIFNWKKTNIGDRYELKVSNIGLWLALISLKRFNIINVYIETPKRILRLNHKLNDTNSININTIDDIFSDMIKKNFDDKKLIELNEKEIAILGDIVKTDKNDEEIEANVLSLDDKDNDTDNINWIQNYYKKTNDNENNNDDDTDKINKIHEKLVVNSSKLFIDHNFSDDKDNLITIDGMDMPKIIETKVFTKRNDIFENIKKSHIWISQTIPDEELPLTLSDKYLLSCDEIDLLKKILIFIETFKETGAKTHDILKEFCNHNKLLLVKIINILIDLKFILRTGVLTITYVYKKYVHPWLIHTYHILRIEKESIESSSANFMYINENNKRPALAQHPDDMETNEQNEKKIKLDTDVPQKLANKVLLQNDESKNMNCKRERLQLIPAPWVRVNGSVNRRVLDRWLGALLLYCSCAPGSTITKLCTRFNFLQPTSLIELLDILEEIECIERFVKAKQKSNLWSTFDSLIIEPATEFDSLDDVFVEVALDAVLKLSIFIGEKKYKTEFI